MPFKLTLQFGILLLLLIPACGVFSQQTTARRHRLHRDNSADKRWEVSALLDGYFVPGEQGYVDPIVTADRNWVHLEARYNYEDLKTGSLWLGYNFNFTSSNSDPDKKIDLIFTPMLGGVFGRTNGVAPGCEASLTYKKFNFWISNEYVFDIGDSSGNFFYTWPQITYTPVDWLHVGFVAQRTFAVENDGQVGFLVGLSHRKTEFTSYILDPGSKPTVILELGYNF